MKKTLHNSEHYPWGENCEGWHFVKSDELSVIYEKIPPGSGEAMHTHSKVQQFFYIVTGTAQFEVNGETVVVSSGEGIHILPGLKHRIANLTDKTIEFLVVSQPTSKGDRINA